MSVRRGWLLSLALVLAVIAVGAGWASWLLRREDLSDALVAEAGRVLPEAPPPRPAHVDAAAPGSTADALARLLPALEPLAKELAEDDAARERSYEVVEGARPLAELPAPYAEALERLAPELDALLVATHAERAEFPRARDPFQPAEGATWASFGLAARLAGLRARQALSAGRFDEARRLCLDGLALGRDAAVARGLVGRMMRVTVTRSLLPPCAEVAGAPGVDRQDLLRRLRSIRDAAPPLEAAVRQDGVEMQLIMFGERLSRPQRERLSPRAATWVRNPRERPNLPTQAAGFTSWRDTRRAYEELAAAARLPRREREAALQEMSERWGRHWNPNRSVFSKVAIHFREDARRDDLAAVRHDLLVCAASARLHRDRTGAWPGSLTALDLSAEERARLQGAELSEEAGRLRIRVALPEVKDSPREAAVTVAP